MARKKITSLLGKDLEYSKEFSDAPKISAPAPPTQPPPVEPAAKAAEPAKSAVKQPRSDKAPKPKSQPVPKREPAQTRAVHVRAVPKVDHKPGLETLEKAGLPSSDVVRLAGKRAIAKFTLDRKYIAPQKAERLPTEMSFRTMKTLDAGVLDILRDQADPLRLRSDAAVIQGQLEPVFWKELDVLIKELRKQYS